MKIALAGAKTFGVEVLKMLLEEGHEVVLVSCEQTDKLWGASVERGIEIIRTDLMPKDVEDLGVELIVGAHYKRWIDQSVVDRVPCGAIGYHPSLLPRHRGGDAVRWTIHMGDPIAGGTVYCMEGGADVGPILMQDWCHVVPGWDASDLWREKLFGMGLELLREAVELVQIRGPHYRQETTDQDERVATWEPTMERAPLSEVASHGR